MNEMQGETLNPAMLEAMKKMMPMMMQAFMNQSINTANDASSPNNKSSRNTQDDNTNKDDNTMEWKSKKRKSNTKEKDRNQKERKLDSEREQETVSKKSNKHRTYESQVQSVSRHASNNETHKKHSSSPSIRISRRSDASPSPQHLYDAVEMATCENQYETAFSNNVIDTPPDHHHIKVEVMSSDSVRSHQHEPMYRGEEMIQNTVECYDGGMQESHERRTYRMLQKQLSWCAEENLQLRSSAGIASTIHLTSTHQDALSAVANSSMFSNILHNSTTTMSRHLTLLDWIVSLVTESHKLHLTRSEIGIISTYVAESLAAQSLSRNHINQVMTHIQRLTFFLMASSPATYNVVHYAVASELLLSLSVIPHLAPYVVIDVVDRLTEFVVSTQSSFALAASAGQAISILVRQAEQITRSRHLMNVAEAALVIPRSGTSMHDNHLTDTIVDKFATLASIPLDGNICQYAPLLCVSIWRLISLACETNSSTASRTLVEHIKSLEQSRGVHQRRYE